MTIAREEGNHHHPYIFKAARPTQGSKSRQLEERKEKPCVTVTDYGN
jgi:hypothetical protein